MATPLFNVMLRRYICCGLRFHGVAALIGQIDCNLETNPHSHETLFAIDGYAGFLVVQLYWTVTLIYN